MRYILDTNILVFYIRAPKTRAYLNEIFEPFYEFNEVGISIVTVGEIESIALRNNWKKPRLQLLDQLLNQLNIIEILDNEIVEEYPKIEAFSQGNIEVNGVRCTPRNMGKNDLWIAATTMVTNATLLTSDYDFELLKDKLFPLHLIDNLDFKRV